jgi:hypothetical protein
MSQNSRSQLLLACQNVSTVTDAEALETGETIWFSGSPAFADKDTIALNVDGSTTLVIKEKDALEVLKTGNNYLVKVKIGTDILYRVEVVSRVSHACGCNGDGDDGKNEDIPIIARQSGNGPVITCTTDYYMECQYVHIFDEDGYHRRICIPILRGRTRCSSRVP